jgi:hypothetical protein
VPGGLGARGGFAASCEVMLPGRKEIRRAVWPLARPPIQAHGNV